MRLLDQWKEPINCYFWSAWTSKRCLGLLISYSKFNSSILACRRGCWRAFIWTARTQRTIRVHLLWPSTQPVIHTLTNAATISNSKWDFFMLVRTWTDYPSLDLWVVQRHTGAATELHKEALWEQRQASLAAPHPGYLICERSLNAAVARGRDSPQDQSASVKLPREGWWRNHRAGSETLEEMAAPPGTPWTLRAWVCD